MRSEADIIETMLGPLVKRPDPKLVPRHNPPKPPPLPLPPKPEGLHPPVKGDIQRLVREAYDAGLLKLGEGLAEDVRTLIMFGWEQDIDIPDKQANGGVSAYKTRLRARRRQNEKPGE